jgi:hypothetical protein
MACINRHPGRSGMAEVRFNGVGLYDEAHGSVVPLVFIHEFTGNQ